MSSDRAIQTLYCLTHMCTGVQKQMDLSSALRGLASAPMVGALGASATLALPSDALWRWAAPCLPALVLDPLEGSGPWPGRVALLVAGFVLGYVGRRCVGWGRLRGIRLLLRYQGWVNGNSWKTKIWGILLRLLEGPGPYSTFEFQQCLPAQPLPNLNFTLDRWLEVTKIYLSEAEYAQTCKAVEQFRVNEGPKAQAHLSKLKCSKENWLTDYWMYAAYLSNRDTLMYNNNFCMTFVAGEHLWASDTQLKRAASILKHITRFQGRLNSGVLEPIMLQDSVPLCMEGYKNILNTIRIPGEHVDVVKHFPHNNFIIVIRNSQYFRLELYDVDASGRMTALTEDEFEIQLQRIVDQADAVAEDQPVAVLTSQDRTTWAKQRQILSESNRETLDAIEQCMLVLTLDKGSPKTGEELHILATGGRGKDRWFDKGVSLTVYANTMASSNVEHSSIDAMVFCTFVMDVMCIFDYAESLIPPRPMRAPQRLHWNLKGLEDAIASAMSTWTTAISDIDFHMQLAPYGKGVMKKCRISPDGYIQMAFLLAFYRQFKEIPKVYEPSTHSCAYHRLYHLGRTEAVHPGSEWSVAWARCMDDPSVGREEKRSLLQRAVQHQTQLRLDTTVGLGCDRHLLGLLMASVELGLPRPAIFNDQAWCKPFALSTSQTPNKIYEQYGKDGLHYEFSNGSFGPATLNGYGISYMIYGEDLLNIMIGSKRSGAPASSAQLGRRVREAFVDMRALFS